MDCNSIGRIGCVAVLALWLIPLSASALSAGAAAVEIVPPEDAPLDGMPQRKGLPAAGAHDPLWVRCLYLETDDTALFLVSADLFAIRDDLRRRVLELAPANVPRENVFLIATGTHNGLGGTAGPLMERWTAGRLMPAAFDAAANAFADAMRTAYESSGPATIAYGTATQQVLSRHAFDSSGPIDTQVGVIRVNNAEGEPVAIVTSFAADPVTAGLDHAMLFSADYPGAYYRELETLAGPGCVAIFFNGALGDQIPGNPEDQRGWAWTASVGRLLAIRAKEVANRIEGDEPAIAIRRETRTLPHAPAHARMPETCDLAIIEIGRLAIALLPGRPSVETALVLRERALAMGYDAHFTVGLAGGYLRSFAPPPVYAQNNTFAADSWYGPGMHDWIVRNYSALLSRARSESAEEVPDPKVDEIGAGKVFTLARDPYEAGVQLGRETTAELKKMVAASAANRKNPNQGWWKHAPNFIDASAVSLGAASLEARRLHSLLGPQLARELMGAADGAQLAYDDLLLAHYRNTKAPIERRIAAAITGARAGTEPALVAFGIVPLEDRVPRILELPGRVIIAPGQGWGAAAGMNNRGLVVCSAGSTARPASDWTAARILNDAGTVAEAIALLDTLNGEDTAGCVIADASGAAVRWPDREVITWTVTGTDTSNDAIEKLRTALPETGAIAAETLMDTLFDSVARDSAAVAVFEPAKRRVRIAVTGVDGEPRGYKVFVLTGSGQ